MALLLDRALVRMGTRLTRFRPAVVGLSIPWEYWLMALLVPGYAYFLEGRRKLAALMAVSWAVSLLLFLRFLGHAWLSGWALGAMASAHSSGLGFLLLREFERNPDADRPGLRTQITVPLSFWFVFLTLVYWPLSSAFQNHFAQPLLVGDRIVIFSPMTERRSVKRGELVAVRIKGQNIDGVVVRSGVTCGTYLGAAGSRVEFTPAHVLVNGITQDRLDEMPGSGQMIIGPGTLFIWPVLNQRVINVPRESVQMAYWQLAQVSERNFIGRPFKRWFFWRQDTL
ncbi:MAG TPA: hypothetical protein DCE44_20125 [Verrucomicrobiales bacterium]|nr:hypothetical protein [Verrucomicrobiales bacterium]